MTMNHLGHAIRVGGMTLFAPGVAPRAAITRRPLRRVSAAVLLVLCGVLGNVRPQDVRNRREHSDSAVTTRRNSRLDAFVARATVQGTHDMGLQQVAAPLRSPGQMTVREAWLADFLTFDGTS